MGYLRWVPNVTVEKMEITFFPNRGSNPVRWTQSPTLYCVAIKADLYRKAVQVYHISIPGDIYVVGTHVVVHGETLLMSTHKVFFVQKKEKYQYNSVEKK